MKTDIGSNSPGGIVPQFLFEKLPLWAHSKK